MKEQDWSGAEGTHTRGCIPSSATSERHPCTTREYPHAYPQNRTSPEELYIYVYLGYIYIYITCTHMYIYICIHIYIYTYTHIYIYTIYTYGLHIGSHTRNPSQPHGCTRRAPGPPILPALLLPVHWPEGLGTLEWHTQDWTVVDMVRHRYHNCETYLTYA